MISWVETPWVSSLRSSALPSPSIDGADRDAAVGVGLRVEEDLRVPDALGGGAGEVGVGQFGEVLLGAQDRHQGVVEVEEALQVVEEVGVAQLFGVGVGQVHAVAGGEREGQLGFEGAFDVEVEFGFGEVHGVLVTCGGWVPGP